jgi:hypothetical protein
MFEAGLYKNRLRYPMTAEEFRGFVDEITVLAHDGRHIALVDGSYDVPHPNHQWFLQHCRLLAAQNHFAQDGRQLPASAHELAASDEVVLVVTLDTDAKMSQLKSDQNGKGGVPRPIYPWELRAQYIANFMTPVATGRFRPVVDRITIDGTAEDLEPPLGTHMHLGEVLLSRQALSSWIFYGEHYQRAAEAEELIVASGSGASVVVIPDKTNYSLDRQGKPWGSSGIIKKILRAEGANV